MKSYNTSCCIAGGGPAGMMLGFLLARAGIDVTVLEKHKDFFRDFRGDTIHPSTFELMHELGLLDAFLKVPHQEAKELTAYFNNAAVPIANFSHLNIAKPAVGIMPQWDFLDFLKEQATAYPCFNLLMNTEAKELLQSNGLVTGLKAMTIEGEQVEILAKLVVGADGRHSIVREQSGLKVVETGAPIDVLWFKLSRKAEDPGQVFGRFYYGRIMVLLDRSDYWQCAYVIEKGAFEKLQKQGLEDFKKAVAEVSPFLANRVDELTDWDRIKLLSVAIDHLERWYLPGLLCIGDAAHAMSPIGGVGINLAVQDAVATANTLYPYLKKGAVPVGVLAAVQKRRELPMRVIQRVQIAIQKGIGERQADRQNDSIPLPFRLFKRFPFLRRIPARLIGMGIRPEHIGTPDVGKAK